MHTMDRMRERVIFTSVTSVCTYIINLASVGRLLLNKHTYWHLFLNSKIPVRGERITGERHTGERKHMREIQVREKTI